MKPYPDQQKSIDEIFEAFKTRNRILYQLPTGGGKTAVFSFITKRAKKRTLILAHRQELIDQTLRTLRNIGVACESVIASKKRLKHFAQVYVGMVQTLKNRLKENDNFLHDIELIIVDESHLDFHKEIFDYYPNAKILAVTATPSTLKKINLSICHRCKTQYDTVQDCCGYETQEYTRSFSYSEIYEHLIIGPTISELIYNDRLVRDLNYEIGGVERSQFTVDSKTGDFDTKETDKFFGQPNVVLNYEKICPGEKTIIFNSSTKTNIATYQSFIDAGYENVAMLDSVNTKQSERKPILEWFKNTPDAILMNCGVLTAGFDEPTIQAVIINRATLSLSLWLQMVGRGGRKCDTLYKPHFKVIDLGGNIKAHGKWSDEVDWHSIFYGDGKIRPKKEALENTKDCKNCGAIVPRHATICEFCDATLLEQREKNTTDTVAVLVDEIPLPFGSKIVRYVQHVGRDKNFAWLILINQIIDLFIKHQVTLGTYKKTQDNGKFEESISRIIKEPYQTIQNSQLEGGVLRTKAWIINKIKKKLDENYTRSSNSATGGKVVQK